MPALRKLFGSDGLEGNLACVLLETVWTPHIQNCHLTLCPLRSTLSIAVALKENGSRLFIMQAVERPF